MKFFLLPRPTQLLALIPVSLLSLSASLSFASDTKTESLKNAEDELATLKNRYTETHPRVVEQKQRIAQFQRRIDEEKPAPAPRNAIIRTEIRIQMPKNEGGFDLLAAPTLVTQSGQAASLSIGAFSFVLNSSVDDQNNITTGLELSIGSDEKPAEKTKLPLIKSRPGERNTVPVPGGLTVEIIATLVEPKGISIDFAGGTLGHLVAAINASGSQPFNLIASKEILELSLPPFSIRNAQPRDLARALDQFLEGHEVNVAQEAGDKDSLPVFTIRSRAKPPSSGQTQNSKSKPDVFRSYPLNVYTNKKISVVEVLAAIDTAWTLDPSRRAEDLKVKYHAPTATLLVSSRDDTGWQLVESILQSIHQEAQLLQTNPPQPAPPKP